MAAPPRKGTTLSMIRESCQPREKPMAKPATNCAKNCKRRANLMPIPSCTTSVSPLIRVASSPGCVVSNQPISCRSAEAKYCSLCVTECVA
eukprot:6363-Heterococcus_DN1.PRE.2